LLAVAVGFGRSGVSESALVKVTPSHQTLILAGEYSPARRSTPPFGGAVTASAGAGLTRLTVVAARADSSLVLLRADYFPEQSPTGGALLPASLAAPNLPSDSRDVVIAPRGSRPRMLALTYGRTQGSPGEARLGSHIDVHA
jgi:hypothetical protein